MTEDIKSVSDPTQVDSSEEKALEVALRRCDEAIVWFEQATTRNRLLYRWSTTTAIFLGGLTPVLILFQALYQDYQSIFMVLSALFPAVAAIITGLNGLYQWKDNYARVAFVTQMLKSEKAKFLTRSSSRYRPDLTEHELIANFVTRIEAIGLKEVSDWRTQFDEGMDVSEALRLMMDTRSTLVAGAGSPTVNQVKEPG